MLFTLFIAVLSASSGTSVTAEECPIFRKGRVYNGKHIKIEACPYQVSMNIHQNNICSGSIISDYYVVTAAHCITTLLKYMTLNDVKKRLKIRSGSPYYNKLGTVHVVGDIIVHEKYTVDAFNTPMNDIALISVLEPFKFGRNCQKIKLLESEKEICDGTVAVISGWGKIGSTYPHKLRFARVPIISKIKCNETYSSEGGIGAGQICAGYMKVGGKDACDGDSGGPLVVNRMLAGIVSYGPDCGESGAPGVYTEISYFKMWIMQQTNFIL